MISGKQTWIFETPPTIISTGVVGGPFEELGNIPNDFDYFYSDQWMDEKSFELAHQHMIEDASHYAIEKANLDISDIQFFLHGDLINQLTPSSFAAKNLAIPYLGLFSACATSMEGLALASLIINQMNASYILTGAASHNSAVERQFRYPTEYGSQKPDTSQWTVTGAGVAILSSQGSGPKVTSATIGKVVDRQLKDPFNMGGAMAPPAAFDTITRHLKDRKLDSNYYDYIITGDLAMIGRDLCLDLFKQNGIDIDSERFIDCGLTIYKPDQPIFAGASGPACSAIVTYGHFINKLRNGECNRILVVATGGALLSPLTVQQKQTIPCIAHAVSIENM
ncbi:stage V sporulation protein AD [Gracilibacillus boraciitolerans JCM 21714]|uniref:Stage V sporulation protein AD n=1 Tax=Gracilibacillus boraciitolerans JCM 21714 TaxID=1298598 RepID=W4VGD8_9BACI|nr:stage V sporulation protein AD [Gracilibacillus boraciitolerans]GAE91834.1 stage V sporulation protein AD [Gracilibacillus boraciitolerans JCM 21714]